MYTIHCITFYILYSPEPSLVYNILWRGNGLVLLFSVVLCPHLEAGGDVDAGLASTLIQNAAETLLSSLVNENENEGTHTA
jgi:hypothetical protein